jgi:hypothetical protein
MENLTPEQEKNPAARVMSVQEMTQFADILYRLQGYGEGDKTVDELCEEIQLKLGKKSEAEVNKLLNGN